MLGAEAWVGDIGFRGFMHLKCVVFVCERLSRTAFCLPSWSIVSSVNNEVMELRMRSSSNNSREQDDKTTEGATV